MGNEPAPRAPSDPDRSSSTATTPAATPRPSLRERRRRQTEEEIVAAARRRFARAGYHATLVSAIAEEVGISEATLYRHFPTKSDLATVALRERWAQLADRLAEQPEELDELAAARNVLAGAMDLAELGPDDPVIHEVALIGSTPELAAVVPLLVNEIADQVMEALATRHHRVEPSFRDGVMSRVIVSTVWAASQWWFGDQDRPIADLVAEAFDIVESTRGGDRA